MLNSLFSWSLRQMLYSFEWSLISITKHVVSKLDTEQVMTQTIVYFYSDFLQMIFIPFRLQSRDS